jgi:hypothetical protein
LTNQFYLVVVGLMSLPVDHRMLRMLGLVD